MEKVNVLGTEYTIHRVDNGKDEFMEKMNFGGYCDDRQKKIVILNMKTVPDWEKESDAAIRAMENEILRHELIHAFLSESGLKWDSFTPTKAWAKNEEMIDWLAIQMPKIFKVFEAAGCL